MTRHDTTDGEPTDGTDRPTEGLVDVPTDDRPATTHDVDAGTVYVHELNDCGQPTAGGWIAMDEGATVDAEAHR